MNHYADKRRHIDEQKKQYLRSIAFRGPEKNMTYGQYLATLDDFQRNCSWGCYKEGGVPSCEQYWKRSYLSGPRGYAKEETSSKIRSSWRNQVPKLLLLEDDEFDDVDYDIGDNSNYQKYYDYAWTIWQIISEIVVYLRPGAVDKYGPLGQR